MTAEELKEFTEKFGAEATKQIKAESDKITLALEAKYEEKMKGLISNDAFEAYKKEAVEPLNTLLKTLEDSVTKQGEQITKLSENTASLTPKSFDQFLTEKLCDPNDKSKLNKGLRNGEPMEITADDLKVAGVTSIGGSVGALDNPPSNPWLPGLNGGSGLELFDVTQDSNFVINRVDLGRTNQSYLAWINEQPIEGAVDAEIEEGTTKPQLQPKWKVEFSTAKKVAGWVEVTEELADDLPQLLTRVRRVIEEEVFRGLDNALQTALIAVARPFEITGMDDSVAFANRYDATLALLAQVGEYNYIANTIATHPVTSALMLTSKTTEGAYLMPPFLPRLNAKMVEATKIAKDFALVGDLKQYKVDIYKPFTLRVGMINDNMIQNKFVILGEMRYHRYISDNRKKAIAYDNLTDVAAQINQAA